MGDVRTTCSGLASFISAKLVKELNPMNWRPRKSIAAASSDSHAAAKARSRTGKCFRKMMKSNLTQIDCALEAKSHRRTRFGNAQDGRDGCIGVAEEEKGVQHKAARQWTEVWLELSPGRFTAEIIKSKQDGPSRARITPPSGTLGGGFTDSIPHNLII